MRLGQLLRLVARGRRRRRRQRHMRRVGRRSSAAADCETDSGAGAGRRDERVKRRRIRSGGATLPLGPNAQLQLLAHEGEVGCDEQYRGGFNLRERIFSQWNRSSTVLVKWAQESG